MKRHRRSSGWEVRVLGAIVIASLPWAVASADPTDVTNVPTAGIQKQGYLSTEFVQDVAYINDSGTHRTSLQTEYGLNQHIELGVDFNTFGEGGLVEGDIKFQLADPEKDPIGVAVGVKNVSSSDDFDEFVYGVGTVKWPAAAITLGAGGNDTNDIEALVGAIVPVSDKFTLTADYVSSDEGSTTAGVSYKINKTYGATLWYEDYNEGSNGIVRLTLSGNFDVASMLGR